MIRDLSLIVGLISLGSTSCTMASVPQTSALPVDATLQIRSFPQWGLFQFSPDGRWLAYVVEDERSNGRGTDVWLLNIETGVARNLTDNTGDSRLPKWSPNGHFLAFMSNRDGAHERLWIWDAIKTSLRQVPDVDLKGSRPMEWTPDSRRI